MYDLEFERLTLQQQHDNILHGQFVCTILSLNKTRADFFVFDSQAAGFSRPFLGVIIMFLLKTEVVFDAAHFLSGYNGKCKNLHGHEWRVVIEIAGDSLHTQGQTRDMIADFSDLKKDAREEADVLDHALLIEEGSLKDTTLCALREEGFEIVIFPWRPTAEQLSRYFYEKMLQRGYPVYQVSVYETPTNCASYREV